MRNHLFLPVVALAGGVAGFTVRKWQWTTAYDVQMERFLPGSLSTYVLLGLLGVLAVFFLLTTKPKDRPLPLICTDPLYMTLMAAGGFLFFGAGVLGLLQGIEQLQLWHSGLVPMTASYPMALLLCGGLCLVAGVCVLAVGKQGYRPEQKKTAGLPACLPPFALLVWLFATHQAHATDPIFLGYGVYLSAAVLLTLAHYDAAGFHHGQRHSRRFLFCTLMGTVLSVTSLADSLSFFQMAMAAACVLTALGQAYALLSPLSDPEL